VAAVEAAIEATRFRRPDGDLRHLLLPALNAVQSRIGWVSKGALNAICRRLGVPPAEAYGVASFYALLALEPRARRVIHVCEDLACRAKGAGAIGSRLEATLGPPGATAHGGETTWLRSPCLGLCEKAPVAMIQTAGERPEECSFGPVDAKRPIEESMDGGAGDAGAPSIPQTISPRADGLRLLKRVGLADPGSLDAYRKHGGYVPLERAFARGPAGIIHEVTASGLLGRGGAAFPAGRKWQAVATAPATPHYLICNADESEPGTFKDRILMEEDPFTIIEAMTIAAYATGCAWGFIYIRGEYARAAARLAAAADQARAAGLLGHRIAGKDFSFDVEVRRGGGAYICGEETALFNSIEGFRGEPRSKPPFPTEIGLFGMPTLVNNVETLANIPDIVLEGAGPFAAIGTKSSTGTRLFCLSGCVGRPGLYEVPFGTTLRSLIDLAGGVPEKRTIRAVLLGGAAGTFLGPEDLDLRLTFEDSRAAGASLGSGVVAVFDDRVDLGDIVLRIAAFFRDESCGQCVPCRVGTVRQEEALHRIARAGAGASAGSGDGDRKILEEVGQCMRDASICGLGQTAASAVLSSFRLRPFEKRPAP
jgi:NADH-quinone oxidoreductase subunit F